MAPYTNKDNLHLRVLKMCALQLSVPLAMIFKNSFETGSFPEVWLKSIMVPLFKAKSRHDPGNYRPVSLTSVCCKTMEKVLASELVQYLESCGLLSDRQFGFHKYRSTEDQMLLVYSDVAALVDEHFIVDMIMLDFSKAFEIVSQTVLLQKLKSIGVPAVLLN